MKLLPRLLLPLIAAASFASVAVAQDYPSRPIKLVVGFPPGGPTDIIGRLIGQSLSKEIGQSVIVENRGGAGGVIGANIVAKSKPDGYTLLVSVESAQTRGLALNPSLPYDQSKDFTFIKKVAKQRNLLVVNPSVPVSSVKELIAYAKANPGKLNVGGTFGASPHVGATLFDMLNGTKMTFVNYAGGSQPMSDLMAGTVQVGFFPEATVAQHIQAGKMKALAVAADERSPAFPNLPTIAEAGGKAMDVSPWFGIAGPAGLTPEVVKKLSDALDRVTKHNDFASHLATIGATPINGSTPEKFTKEVGEEIVFWNKWAKDVGTPLAR